MKMVALTQAQSRVMESIKSYGKVTGTEWTPIGRYKGVLGISRATILALVTKGYLEIREGSPGYGDEVRVVVGA